MTRGRHGFYAVPENGPVARSVAPDAHRCIMVQAPSEGLPNTSVLGCSPDGELPSDRPIPLLLHPRRSTRNRERRRLDNCRPIQACPWHEQGHSIAPSRVCRSSPANAGP